MRIHQKFILWKTLLRSGFVFGILAIVHFALAADSTDIPNPIAATSFPCLIKTISAAAIQVAVPIAVITIIIVGLRFVFAGLSGNSAKVTEARKLLLNVVIGTAIIVGSFVIASAAVQLFGAPSPGQVQC
ncbi:MAG: hypothetical protein WAP52_01470 [Candidatus Sungiibacteriota bacterium]